MRTIQYGIDADGMYVSRVGSRVAFPVLEYEKIGEGGDFTAPFRYHLDSDTVLSLVPWVNGVKWTRKIPDGVKETHREFWGFPPRRRHARNV